MSEQAFRIELRAAEIVQELHECKRRGIPTQTITTDERIGWYAAKHCTDRYPGYGGADYIEWWAGWLAFEATKAP